MNRDVPILGFIVGLLLPIAGLFVMKLLWYRHDTLNEFYHTLVYSHSLLAKILSLSLLINLAPFLYCTSRRYDYAMRGIVIATILYFVFIVLIMYVW
jgi:amino acid permease